MLGGRHFQKTVVIPMCTKLTLLYMWYPLSEAQ
jgi:hypothetical protein